MKPIKELQLKADDTLTQMDSAGLKQELNDSKKRLYTMTMKLALGELKQTHLMKPMRRYVAYLHTLINLKR
ncbi:50S ribosomal protein L29 [Candidatus Gracilibacteria bacterium]|nr:50S ribosomal protein L29 [Candidatus Gracilibacteria bacterium]